MLHLLLIHVGGGAIFRSYDKDVRKFFLRREMGDIIIPPFAYLPLCRSLDTYKYVLRALPQECRIFNTKARCPALMLFEVEEHPSGLDVASFLNSDLHEFRDQEIIVPNMTAAASELVLDGDQSDSHMPVQREPSRFSRPSRGLELWMPEGTGMNRYVT